MSIKSLSGIVGAYQAQLNRADPASLAANRAGRADRNNPAAAHGKTDSVSLSSDAALRKKALEEANNAPDLRLEKMETIRQSLEDNSYIIDNKKIAAKIIAEESFLLEN